MFNEQSIVGKADAALMRKCRFNTVRIKMPAQSTAHGVRYAEGIAQVVPTHHTEGSLSDQELIFGDGDIRIKLQFHAKALFRAEIRSRELYKEACHEWAKTVKSELPHIEIVFLDP